MHLVLSFGSTLDQLAEIVSQLCCCRTHWLQAQKANLRRAGSIRVGARQSALLRVQVVFHSCSGLILLRPLYRHGTTVECGGVTCELAPYLAVAFSTVLDTAKMLLTPPCDLTPEAPTPATADA